MLARRGLPVHRCVPLSSDRFGDLRDVGEQLVSAIQALMYGCDEVINREAFKNYVGLHVRVR